MVDPADVATGLRLPATESSTDTPLWSTLEQVAKTIHPGGRLVPSVLPGQTDARWLRPAGVTVYGFGALSARVTPGEYWSRFHGRNERIDVESLDLSLTAWEAVVRTFLG